MCLAVGCFRAFVWHLSLSVVAAREHLWRSSLRGVGGDSVEAVRVSCRTGQVTVRERGRGLGPGDVGACTEGRLKEGHKQCILQPPPLGSRRRRVCQSTRHRVLSSEDTESSVASVDVIEESEDGDCG